MNVKKRILEKNTLWSLAMLQHIYLSFDLDLDLVLKPSGAWVFSPILCKYKILCFIHASSKPM